MGIYLKNVRERYQKSTKKLKTAILSEFCVNSGYNRKHASRILTGVLEPRKARPGPKLKYNSDKFLRHLKFFWESMNRMCGKNMVAALPIWLPKYSEKILVGLMNEIYQVYWNPLQNFFTPTIKMEKKERVGSKVKKTYSKPKTPYQRLIECDYLSRLEKKAKDFNEKNRREQ